MCGCEDVIEDEERCEVVRVSRYMWLTMLGFDVVRMRISEYLSISLYVVQGKL